MMFFGTGSKNIIYNSKGENLAYGYGDAILEISTGMNTSSAWFKDYSTYAAGTNPFFVRENGNSLRAITGTFSFISAYGGNTEDNAIRMVLAGN